MKLEVFFSTAVDPAQTDDLRFSMSLLCFDRWKAEPDIELKFLSAAMMGIDPRRFQRDRRVFADRTAKNDIYLLVDDDIFLPYDSGIEEAVETFVGYPDFAILSPQYHPGKISPWTPERYSPLVDEFVLQHYETGGARFSRKGLIEEWPPMPEEGPPRYDNLHCRALTEAGWRVGYFQNIKWWHLGEGYSQVWSHKNPHQSVSTIQ